MKQIKISSLSAILLLFAVLTGANNANAQYCNGTTYLTASSGSFSDGSGASNYMDYSSCSWLIQPSAGATSITLSFSSFATESCCDYVTIYDGNSTAATVLGTYRGSSLPPTLTSSGGAMFIEFYTDGSVTYQGWSASYTSVALCTAPTPTVTASGPVSFCGSGSVTLTSSSASSYLWSDGSTMQSITVNQSGNYSVFITDASGCTATSAVTAVTDNGPYASATTDLSSVCTGGTVQLNASAGSSLSDSFDPLNSSVWSVINGGVEATTCGSVSGNALYFNGSAREAATIDLNTSAGGTISFYLKIGTGSSPCENADFGEDVKLEYSNNGGSTWTNINTYLTGTTYQNFTSISLSIPAGAQTPATRFRWVQPNFSGIGTDNWSLDDVSIVAGGGGGSYSYSWSPATGLSDPAISNPIATVSANTTYTVTITDLGSSCSSTATVSVNTFTPSSATITPSGSTTFCQGGSVDLSANNGISYLWSNSATTQTVSVNQAGTYSVTVTYAGGCTSTSAGTNVIVNTPVTATITAGGPTSFCANGNVVLSSNSSSSYLWSNGATTQSTTITQTGSYSVITIDINGCKDTSTAVSVTNNGPYAMATSDYSSVCAGGTVQLAGTSGSTITDNFDPLNNSLWSSINGGVEATTCGSVSGNALYFNGSTREAITKDMNTSSGGTISFYLKIGTGSSPCEQADLGEDVQLSYSNNGGSTWTNINTYLTGTTYQNFTSISLSIPAGARTSSTRFKWSQPNFSGIGTDNWSLDNVSIIAGATGTYSYSWLPATGLSDPAISNPTATVSGNTTYTVTVTDLGSSCSNTATVSVNTFNPAPATVSTTGNTTFCQGGNVILTANNGVGYLWSNSDTTRSISATQTGTYSVTVTYAGGCTSTSGGTSVTVNSPVPAVITPSGPTSFCGGGSVSLSCNTANSYLWSTGSGAQSITVSQSGNYNVITVDSNGCRDTSSVMAVTNYGPNITVGANNTSVCSGTTIQLSGFVGSSLQDNFDPSNASMWSNISGGILANTCGSVSGNAMYFEGNLKKAETINLNTSAGGTIDFYLKIAYNTYTYLCYNAYSGNDIYLEYSNNGGSTWNYIAVYYAGNSTYQNFTSVSVNIPVAARTSSTKFRWNQPYTYGSGYDNWALDNVSISSGGTGNYTYAWTPSAGLSDATIANPSAIVNGNTTYTLTVTDLNSNCSNSDTVVVTGYDVPVATITPSAPVSFCTGGNVVFTATTGAGYSYQWNKNGTNISGATSSSYTATTTGNYKVIVTEGSCSSTSVTTTVNVYSTPTATITAGGPASFCQGGNVALTANSGSSYLWNTGENTQSISATNSGNYSVTIANPSGCSGSATSPLFNVNVYPLPPTPTITQSGNLLVSSSATGNQWYINGILISGAISQSLYTTTDGSYTVSVTDGNGCTSSSSAFLTGISDNLVSEGSFKSFPNPFNDQTTITFDLIEKAKVSLEIYDLVGQQIGVIVSEENQAPGAHSYNYSVLNPGIYFIHLKANGVTYREKIICVK